MTTQHTITEHGKRDANGLIAVFPNDSARLPHGTMNALMVSMTNTKTQRADTLCEAIERGIQRAAERNLTKPNDIAFSIMVSIDDAGLSIVSKRTSNNFTEGNR